MGICFLPVCGLSLSSQWKFLLCSNVIRVFLAKLTHEAFCSFQTYTKKKYIHHHISYHTEADWTFIWSSVGGLTFVARIRRLRRYFSVDIQMYQKYYCLSSYLAVSSSALEKIHRSSPERFACVWHTYKLWRCSWACERKSAVTVNEKDVTEWDRSAAKNSHHLEVVSLQRSKSKPQRNQKSTILMLEEPW